MHASIPITFISIYSADSCNACGHLDECKEYRKHIALFLVLILKPFQGDDCEGFKLKRSDVCKISIVFYIHIVYTTPLYINIINTQFKYAIIVCPYSIIQSMKLNSIRYQWELYRFFLMQFCLISQNVFIFTLQNPYHLICITCSC